MCVQPWGQGISAVAQTSKAKHGSGSCLTKHMSMFDTCGSAAA